MADLPPWVTLSLREPLDADGVVRRAAALGVRAAVTRDGIQFPGSFLARIDASPFPRRLLDSSLVEGQVEVGPATLHISGGTNELARDSHCQPADIRAMQARVAASTAAAAGLSDNGHIESAASRKMRDLTALVAALGPIASAVILPRANHLVFESEAFVATAQEYLGGPGYHFPLWAFLKLRDDEDCEHLASVGMWPFGLADVAMPLPAGADRRSVVLAVGAIQREMVAEGLWPEDGSTLSTPLGDVRLSRVHDGLWAMPLALLESTAIRRAHARFSRQKGLEKLLGPHTLHHTPMQQGRVAIEHFLRSDSISMAITNGLSDQAMPGSTAEDENDYVELTLCSPNLGPWANGWLGWASEYLSGHDGSRPIRARDRLVLPHPEQGIAGVIVWPMGHLAPLRSDDRTVWLWDLIPFTPDELAMFRADPNAQRTWMEERIEQNDIPTIQARWGLAAGP